MHSPTSPFKLLKFINLSFLAIFIIIFSLPFSASSKTATLTLIYSGNLDGEIEPCGCSEDSDYGGIQRRAAVVDDLRKKNPSLVLISSGGLLLAQKGSDRIKNKYILKGFAILNYDAVGLQWKDLVHGHDFLTKENVPFVASNWASEFFNDRKLIEREGVSLSFFNWLDSKNPVNFETGENSLPADSSSDSVQQLLGEAKKHGRITIFSTDLDLVDVERLFDVGSMDILLINSQQDKIADPVKLGNTLVLRPDVGGMRLGRLDLEVSESGGIVGWSHSVIPLNNQIADSPRLKSWYENYIEEMRQDYLRRVEIRKSEIAGDAPYSGAGLCEKCHGEELRKWKTTRHAGAFETLAKVKKSFDSECIKCHVVGFADAGGFLDPNITPHLKGVQCESCHGPGRGHIHAAGASRTVNSNRDYSRICAECHDSRRSPDFSFNVYWSKIAH